MDSAGRNRASRHIERPLRSLGADELMDVLAETIAAFAQDTGAADVKAIGLACQGYVDTRTGSSPGARCSAPATFPSPPASASGSASRC